MKKKKPLDPVLAGRALTALGFRVLVAGYLVYLAWKILTGVLAGGSPIPVWCGWLIFVVFVGGALSFCVFSWKQYRLLRKDAEYPPETDNTEETDDPE